MKLFIKAKTCINIQSHGVQHLRSFSYVSDLWVLFDMSQNTQATQIYNSPDSNRLFVFSKIVTIPTWSHAKGADALQAHPTNLREA